MPNEKSQKTTAENSNTYKVDLDKIRPDPVLTERVHQKQAFLSSALLSIGLGGITYMGAHFLKKNSDVKLIATATAAVLGAILGYITGKNQRTYEERSYEIISSAANKPEISKELQQNVIQELKRKDREDAEQYYTGGM